MAEYNCPLAGIDRCVTVPPSVRTDRKLTCQECQLETAKSAVIAQTMAVVTIPGASWADNSTAQVTREQQAHGDAQVAKPWAFSLWSHVRGLRLAA